MINCQEKTIEIDGLQVHYKVAGEGTPFLILHGWGSSSERWIKTAELLAKDGPLQVVIPDLPGFGKSHTPPKVWGMEEYCEFVDRFAHTLGLREFYLFGHSFGGGVALMHASKNPEKVRKLFLVAAAIRRERTARKRMIEVAAKLFKLFSFLPFYILFRRAFYKYVIRKSDYSYQTGIIKSIYLKVITQDLTHLLSGLKVPTVIIWGEKDSVTPLRDGQFIHKILKDSQLLVVPQGDHDLERKVPTVLVEHIIKSL